MTSVRAAVAWLDCSASLACGVRRCGATTAAAPSRPGTSFEVLAGGNNVPDRYSSDLWVHGTYAYTGTWGGALRNGNAGNVVNIWSLDAAGAPTLVDSLVVAGHRHGERRAGERRRAACWCSARSGARTPGSTSTT